MNPYVVTIKSLLNAIRENLDLDYRVIQDEKFHQIQFGGTHYTVRLMRDNGVIFVTNFNPYRIEEVESQELYEEFKKTVENFII